MLWDICEGNLGTDSNKNLDLDDGKLIDTVEKEPLIERDENVGSDEEILDDNEDGSVGENSASSGSELEEEDEAQLVEDIYGRTVDSKTGKIIKGVDTSKAQEKLDQLNEESELTNEARLALTKSIRSILNRFVFFSLSFR